MSEFNIEDLDAVIASAESSLVQMLALQLKRQIRKCEQMAADNEKAMDSLRQADAAVKLAHEKYSAIAAENVALNNFVAQSCYVQAGENASWHPAIDHAPETDATDRIVAGIKADGVEEFVEKCREKAKQAISSDIRDNWWLAGEHADDFAKQLREGAK